MREIGLPNRDIVKKTERRYKRNIKQIELKVREIGLPNRDIVKKTERRYKREGAPTSLESWITGKQVGSAWL